MPKMIHVPHASRLYERHGPPGGLTPSKTYSSEVAARRAIEGLRAAGVPAPDIRLLTGTRLRDVRREAVGGFAGPVAPNASIGTYGDRRVLRRQGAGGFAGDTDRQRQGSFADTDRVVTTTYKRDAERARVTGLPGARRLLGQASLDDNTVDRAMHELPRGRAVVLVDVSEIVASEARPQLERDARAA